MILFINACIRKNSRTKQLADHLINKLKQYFEQINCVGITFKYAPEGYPIPLCNAKQLIYVMSAGGEFVPEEFGFGYVKSLAENFYGIKDVRLVKAVGLDIDGADVDKIMEDAMKQIDNCFAQ